MIKSYLLNVGGISFSAPITVVVVVVNGEEAVAVEAAMVVEMLVVVGHREVDVQDRCRVSCAGQKMSQKSWRTRIPPHCY